MRPYFAASKARSRSSTAVIATTIRPRSRPVVGGRGERGQPVEDEVDLGGHAGRADVRRAPAQVGPMATGSTRPGEQALGVEPGDDRAAAISSPLASATPVARPSRRGHGDDLGAGPDLGAGARARLPAPGPAPGPPSREHGLAGRAAVVAGRVVEQLRVPADHGPIAVWRTPRHASVARIASSSDRSSTKSATAIGEHAQDRPAVGLPAPERRPSREAQPRASPEARGLESGGPRRRGRRGTARGPDLGRTRKAVGVGRRTRGAGRRRVARGHRPQGVTARPSGCGANTRTAGATSGRPWRLRSSSRAIDGRRRPTVCASAGRGRRGELGGGGGAADPVAALEDERAQARPGQVGRRDQPVVAAADDDRVVAPSAGPSWPPSRQPRPPSTSSAARRPLAPMMPPPGCADEPHSQRSRTGVRNRA